MTRTKNSVQSEAVPPRDLREIDIRWFLKRIPARVQHGVSVSDLHLTKVDFRDESLAIGTNVGLVYFFAWVNNEMYKLRCEDAISPVTAIAVESSVEFMVAAGSPQGHVTIFQVPKVKHSMGVGKTARFTVKGFHDCEITALIWSSNGETLFSGDERGTVVMTRMNFDKNQSESSLVLRECTRIVQLSYIKKKLLTSSALRSVVCDIGKPRTSEMDPPCESSFEVHQVGTKIRKSPSDLGAVLRSRNNLAVSSDLEVICCRPGWRIWKADAGGVVQQTLLYKDLIHGGPSDAPNPEESPLHDSAHGFGQCVWFDSEEERLVTWAQNRFFILDLRGPGVLESFMLPFELKDLASDGRKVFVLGENRTLKLFTSSLSGMAGGCYAENQDFDVIESGPSASWGLDALDLRSKLDKLVPQNVKGLEDFVERSSKKLISLADAALIGDSIFRATPAKEGTKLDPVIPPLIVEVEGGPSEAGQEAEVGLDPLENTFDDFVDGGEVEFSVQAVASRPEKKKRNSRGKRPPFFSPGGVSQSSSESSVLSQEVVEEAKGSCQENMASTAATLSALLQEKYVPSSETLASEEEIALKEDLLGKLININFGSTSEDEEEGSVNQECAAEEDASTVPENDVRESDASMTIVESYSDHGSLDGFMYGPPSRDDSSIASHAHSVEEEQLTSCLETSTEVEPCVRPDTPGISTEWAEFAGPGGQIVSLALCKHLVVACVKSGNVFCSPFEGLGLKWTKLSWKADHVAFCASPLGGDVVWRLHRGVLYAFFRPTVEKTSISGVRWIRCDDDEGSITCMTLDRSGGVGWCCFENGSVLVYDGLTSTRPLSKPVQLESLPCKPGEPAPVVISIKASGGIVWALLTTGELWVRIGTSRDRPQGLEWAPIGDKLLAPILAFEFGPRGTAFAANAEGKVFFTREISRLHPAGDDVWWEVSLFGSIVPGVSPSWFASLLYPDAKIRCPGQTRGAPMNWLRPPQIAALMTSGSYLPVIAGNDKNLWLVCGSSSTLHRAKQSVGGHRWTPAEIRGLQTLQWKMLEAGSVYKKHGVLWMLSHSGDKLFSYPAYASYRNRPMQLTLPDPEDLIVKMTSGPEALWILTASRKIFIRDGISESRPEGHSWVRLDLDQLGDAMITSVSISSEVAWAVDHRGDMWMRLGSLRPPTTASLPPAWVPIEAGDALPSGCYFQSVFMGPKSDMVWAIDSKHKVYVRSAILPELPIGVDWVSVSGVDAVQIAISETTVWALSMTGEIWRRFGVSPTNVAGDYWKKIPCDSAVYISVSVDDRLWVVDASGNLASHRFVNYALDDSENSNSSSDCLKDSDQECVESNVEGDWLLVS